MITVTPEIYEKLKIRFLSKHENWEVETSPIDQYDTYRKTYHCEDGADWFEVINPVYETITLRGFSHGIAIEETKEIKLLKVEGWSTDYSKSVVCYERY